MSTAIIFARLKEAAALMAVMYSGLFFSSVCSVVMICPCCVVLSLFPEFVLVLELSPLVEVAPVNVFSSVPLVEVFSLSVPLFVSFTVTV